MPEIGELKKNNHRDNLVWLACSTCGKERWVKISDSRRLNFTGLCQSCCLRERNGKLQDSPNWKGGIKICGGRVFIWLSPNHPFICMADNLGYVKRARLVMAEHLGRPLTSEEEVHHKDENISNDTYSNLVFFETKGEHIKYHRLKEIKIMGLRPTNGLGQYIKGGYKYAY